MVNVLETTIAYADDLALLVSGKTMLELELIAQEALDAIEFWMRRNHLKLAPEKTEAVMLIKLAGHSIMTSKAVKHLGVDLANNCNFEKPRLAVNC